MIDKSKREFIDFLKAACSRVDEPPSSINSGSMPSAIAISRRVVNPQDLSLELHPSDSCQQKQVDSFRSVPR